MYLLIKVNTDHGWIYNPLYTNQLAFVNKDDVDSVGVQALYREELQPLEISVYDESSDTLQVMVHEGE